MRRRGFLRGVIEGVTDKRQRETTKELEGELQGLDWKEHEDLQELAKVQECWNDLAIKWVHPQPLPPRRRS